MTDSKRQQLFEAMSNQVMDLRIRITTAMAMIDSEELDKKGGA